MCILAAVIFKRPVYPTDRSFCFLSTKIPGEMCYKALQDIEEELFIVVGGTDTVNWSNEKSLGKICRHDSQVEMSLVYCSFSYNGKEFSFSYVGSMNYSRKTSGIICNASVEDCDIISSWFQQVCCSYNNYRGRTRKVATRSETTAITLA